MLASYKWLKELCAFEASVDDVRTRFTAAGLEVESVKEYGYLPGVVIAEVRGKKPHPNKDKLSLVTLFDGERELEVVCGAPNVPVAGKRVLFARLGAKLPNGMEIAERKLAGVVSQGMICSEVELDIGSESDGIFIVDDEVDAKPGTLASDALGLRDSVFEIGLTPNRPDCLGHVGLSRELSALLSAPLRLPKVKEPARMSRVPEQPKGTRPVALFTGAAGAPAAASVPIVVADAERCPRYATCVVEDVRVGPSPFWLRYRLHVLGVRAISNVVDITNLVLLEYGYPTHAFDLALVRGGRIEVRVGRAGETITTLDGLVRPVSADDLMICDGEGPVAVAGVMGGEHSGVSAETKRVLVECAYFDPRGVRRTSRRLGLHTDASHRFERGVDPRAVPGVLGRVVSLLAEVANGQPCQIGFEVYPQPISPRQIVLRLARAEALLGVSLPEDVPQSVLEALGCEVEVQSGQRLKVRAPTWRPDLTREEDLIEEIVRVWGYDKVPTVTPIVRAAGQGTTPLTRFVRSLKLRAAAVGMTEALNLAFVSPKQLERARVATDAVRLLNPMSEERSVMRTSLLPGLAANVLRAQRHQVPRVTLFELARVFTPSKESLPIQPYRFAVILAGTRADWIGEGGSMDFFDGKGVLEAVIKPLTRLSIETKANESLASAYPFLHPRKLAEVSVGGNVVGVLGELHPDVVEDLELVGPVVYADLSVEDLLAASRADLPPQVRPIPRFPASARDLALEVDEAIEAGNVGEALRKAGGTLVEAVELFDLYRGEQVGKGRKSLAFRVTYRDPEATLTDQRVDEAHSRVTAEAQRRFGAAMR